MMKPTANYRMSKTAKRLLQWTPKGVKGIFKRMLIDAELHEALKPRIKTDKPKRETDSE